MVDSSRNKQHEAFRSDIAVISTLSCLSGTECTPLTLPGLGVSPNHVTCPWSVTFSLPLELQELKVMMLGSAAACFSEEWRCQSFTFSSRPALRYGIVQKKVSHHAPQTLPVYLLEPFISRGSVGF